MKKVTFLRASECIIVKSQWRFRFAKRQGAHSSSRAFITQRVANRSSPVTYVPIYISSIYFFAFYFVIFKIPIFNDTVLKNIFVDIRSRICTRITKVNVYVN